MAGKSDAFEMATLKLFLNGLQLDNMAGDLTGVGVTTAPMKHLSLALHTADPGDTGTMATSEHTVAGYRRTLVLRTTSGWTVTGTTTANPTSTISFQVLTATSGSNATYFSVGFPQVSAVTVTAANPGVVSLTAHGFEAETPFTFAATTLPAGTAATTIYYVSATTLNANDFRFSATVAGALFDTTGTASSGVVILAAKRTAATTYAYAGQITTPSGGIVMGNTVTPQLTTATAITED